MQIPILIVYISQVTFYQDSFFVEAFRLLNEALIKRLARPLVADFVLDPGAGKLARTSWTIPSARLLAAEASGLSWR